MDNIDAIIAADRISDELGIDTISAGATIAFAMEIFEKGIISTADTGGIELNFGNHKAMVEADGLQGGLWRCPVRWVEDRCRTNRQRSRKVCHACEGA